MRAALFLTLAVHCLAFRAKSRNHNATSKGLVLKGADCDQLQNINVGGRDLGQAVVLLCRFWPSNFGDFPVNNVQTVVDLFNGATDLWEKIKELAKGSEGSGFCWKKFGIRERLNSIHMTGALEMNRSEVAMSQNCDMEIFGTCYGACPGGYKSAALIGGFAPVCSSACVQSTHQTPCGFGCSTGIGQCVTQLTDQLTVVASAVGQVASFLSGQPLINEVVDQVLRLVEFAIDVVFNLVAVAKQVFEQWPRDKIELGLIIALVQFVLENAKTIGQDLLQLNEMFGETMEMILELVDAEFDWKEINLEFIGDTILKHGRSILGAANEFAQAFVFPQCEVVSDTNPDYDCNGDGSKDCGDFDFWKFSCSDNVDDGGKCDYQYKFGDMLFDHSCRCAGRR